jgi:peptidoglycan/xylan/chitin deacetylase (PgdA/CDA1 family)
VKIPNGSVGLFIKWPGDQGLGLTLFISNDFGYTNAASYFLTGPTAVPNGWMLVLIAQSDFTLGGTFSWATGMKQWRIALSGASASYPEVGFGGMVLGVKSKPIIFLSCDDGWKQQRDVALPILQKYGYTATMYLNGVNSGNANYMTTAQLQEMQNIHGWDMANHGFGHLHYPTLTEAQMIADYANNVTWLNSIGANSPNHFCYPYGEAAAGVGGAIPAQVLAAQGAITGRLATSAFYRGFQSYPGMGLVDPMHMRAFSFGAGAVLNTVSVMQANIDSAIARSEHCAPYFHKVIDQQNPTGTGGTLPVDGNEYYKDDFEAVIAYCRAKEDAGQCTVVGSVRELYKLTQS